MAENDFKVTKGFKSYVSKPEITDLDPRFLVRGSKNMIIDYANRVISRNGYTLYNQANTGQGGIKSGYLWETSTGGIFDIRVFDTTMEFDWDGLYRPLKNDLYSSAVMFTKVFDTVEKIDQLVFVTGEQKFYTWSGGVSEVSESTATTVKKRGVITASTAISFDAGIPGTVSPTITDSLARFVTEGFAAGQTIYVTGSAANSRVFTVGSVTAGTITLIMPDVLATEAAGPAITVHNGEPTWARARFLTTGTREIEYNGTRYAYTGGESTDTLTGLTGFPVLGPGDRVWQATVSVAHPSPAISGNFYSDYCGVQLNQLILSSASSQEVYGSRNTDYKDYTLTSPRAPADPFKVTLDGPCTFIQAQDNQDQSVNALLFGSGKSATFRLLYQMSQDNTNELVRMVKLKTAESSGLVSRNAIRAISNSVAYVSNEPTFDLIGNIESGIDSRTAPLSDIIKNDFDSYDFQGSDVYYWKRSAYIAVPAEGLFLIYDFMRGLWQPPQYAPIGKWTIIGGWLHGHSSVTNETYRMFDGTSDNGVYIPQVARFAYNNGGRRDRIKNMTEYWTDGYITPNGRLTMKQYLGYEGLEAVKEMQISGSDTDIVVPIEGSRLGDEPLGATPLGGASLSPIPDLPGSEGAFLRFHQDDTMTLVDYKESFVEYSMDTLGGQFAVVAHGSNQYDAGTSLGKIMK